VVDWNGAPLATTFVSAGTLTASVPAADLASAGAASVTVSGGAAGSASSAPAAFAVGAAANPAPTLNSIDPANATAGDPALTLTVSGAGFTSASTVDWNGAPLATTFVNATTMTALVPASDLAGPSAGAIENVTVVTPAPGGGTSAPYPFLLVHAPSPVPVIASLSPTSAQVGSAPLTVTVSGSNFVPSSVVSFGPTTYVNANTLTASLTANMLSIAQTLSVTVTNPAPGGGISNVVSFPIVSAPSPVPTLASISPATVTAGDQAVTLELSGTNFTAYSTVSFAGQYISSTYNSPTSLTLALPSGYLGYAGSYPITVTNPAPGGGTTAALSLVVTQPAGITQLPLTANQMVWDPNSALLYLSTPSTAANGNSVEALDPTTGHLGAVGYAGSEPNLLAVSANGAYIYVGLDGSGSVARLTLPNLQPNLSVSLGAGAYVGTYTARDLQASPAADSTWAVSRGIVGDEEGGLLIYDDDRARPDRLCGFNEIGCTGGGEAELFDSIQWNAAGSAMYMGNTEDSGSDFYVSAVTASGIQPPTDYSGDLGGFVPAIHYDATTGYVYVDNGRILNPADGSLVGTFAASGSVLPDGAAGLAYVLSRSSGPGGETAVIQSFNIHTFTPVNTLTVPGVYGDPVRLVRWGTAGLAFVTHGSGEPLINGDTGNDVFVIQNSSFVGNTSPTPTMQAVQ
jgi:hypothetical protein